MLKLKRGNQRVFWNPHGWLEPSCKKLAHTVAKTPCHLGKRWFFGECSHRAVTENRRRETRADLTLLTPENRLMQQTGVAAAYRTVTPVCPI
jgi:hypothetical protein